MAIDPLVASVSKLILKKNGSIEGSATGFFYENNSKLFLITNRHVVIDEEKKFYPDEIVLRLHADPNNLQNNQDLALQLYQGKKPIWLEHPKICKNAHIVSKYKLKAS